MTIQSQCVIISVEKEISENMKTEGAMLHPLALGDGPEPELMCIFGTGDALWACVCSSPATGWCVAAADLTAVAPCLRELRYDLWHYIELNRVFKSRNITVRISNIFCPVFCAGDDP